MTTLPTDGLASWTNFQSYWAAESADWLAQRVIGRYPTFAALQPVEADPGTFAWVDGPGLEILYKRTVAGAWERYAGLPGYLYADTDDANSVVIGHITDPADPVNSFQAGVSLGQTEVGIPLDLNVLDVLGVSASGVSIKTGDATALLTTDTDALVSDVKIQAPSLEIAGDVAAASATISGTIQGADLTVTGAANVAGTATVNRLDVGANVNVQSDGFHDGNAWYRDGGSGARVEYNGDAYITVQDTDILPRTPSGFTGFVDQVRFDVDAPAGYYDGATFRCNLAGAFYSTGSPSAANYPDGTIWVG